MTSSIENRQELLGCLQRELVGPDPRGDSIDLRPGLELPDPKEEREAHADDKTFIPQAHRPWRHTSGEEILTMDRPGKRYGVGVLYPRQTDSTDPGEFSDEAATSEEESEGPTNNLVTAAAADDLQRIQSRGGSQPEDAVDAFDGVVGANSYLPSALGVSFLLDVSTASRLSLRFNAARYVPVSVSAGSLTQQWWLRRPVTAAAEVPLDDLSRVTRDAVLPVEVAVEGMHGDGKRLPDIRVGFHVLVRPYEGTIKRDTRGPAERLLVTATIVNYATRTDGENADLLTLFQTRLEVIATGGDPTTGAIAAYPRSSSDHLDEDEEGIELLYRNQLTFAVGHGCAADWDDAPNGMAGRVWSNSLPTYELPSVTPDLQPSGEGSADATPPVRMAALGGLTPGDDGLVSLNRVVEEYERWIAQKDKEVQTLDARYRSAAERNVAACKVAARRMRGGLEMLREPGRDADLIRTAFRLANHSMWLQRLRGSHREARRFTWLEKSRQWTLSSPHPSLPGTADVDGAVWRPFQIAFMLMALPSTAISNDQFREAVDLIWFPTGGGKTEAYLGLAAFSIFLRRLRALKYGDSTEDHGVQVLMRYTLRLLTAQQFQRAAALLCAMEFLRRHPPSGIELGNAPFTLGMWTGATPNDRARARKAFKSLSEGHQPEDNIIVLERCPWCQAAMGPRQRPAKGRRRSDIDILGYERRARGQSAAETVVAACPDHQCEFHAELPLHFVDEDMYVAPPSMVIGTVDKFAMLAWRPQARALFGRDNTGRQVAGPPGLILQDELHLISGPLGTMVGLYETAIEHLCTDVRGESHVRPKIVSSTATIRSYEEQVRRVFGRPGAKLFPPPGLDANDSFFARVAKTPNGKPLPGRIYVGVHAPGLGSVQTAQVRVYSALIQGVASLPGGALEKDPWWTLLTFYNSLRELGGGLTLFFSDVPDYLWAAVRRRLGLAPSDVRRLRRVEELTGRLDDQDVVSVISKLETPTTSGEPAVDVCLASNIIEVGVDIDRLSLLAVVGQPKSTAQYIQVTGRIGRNWKERPGLVVTVYSPSKPRDRSHYERFRTYHQQLYAQVEPTSVTPFSPPALDRALHAVLIAYLRQIAPMALVSDQSLPLISDSTMGSLLSEFESLARSRIGRVGHGEIQDLDAALRTRLDEWRRWQPRRWSGDVTPDRTDVPLMRWPGRYVSRQAARFSWAAPTSMRNVDAECRVEITGHYVDADATRDGAQEATDG